MEPQFKPQEHEEKLRSLWQEKLSSYTQRILTENSEGETFSIVLPPPNANASLHVGHAMYVYEDIMVRYHMLKGVKTLWIPGVDHAGFETQFVYEKQLAKEGKSRFDFSREELYKNIYDFVMSNKGLIENQLSALGFLLPWQYSQFTLSKPIVHIVYQTFKKLFDEGLIYREKKLINYCVKDGTSFSDLEVVDKEATGVLYFIRYPLAGEKGYITVATTRPETILGDVGVMVNPKDKRYRSFVGKSVKLPFTGRVVPVIADSYVDKTFGTGAVKITPSHDFNDFEVAKRHKELPQHDAVIGFNGRIQNTGTKFDGLKVREAREQMVAELTSMGLLEKTAEHPMVLKTCYKCGQVLEPLPLEQWFVKVAPLTENVIKAIDAGEVAFTPKRSKKTALMWLKNFRDWNISRQIVWGIRIPAFQNPQTKQWVVEIHEEKQKELIKNGYIQDTDTFDTWFSSSQWPFATLLAMGGATLENAQESRAFKRFYPTSVMETGYDILPWWVCRMLFMGMYTTGKLPFKHIFLHGLVRDAKGQKMSKSKGNVVNPLEVCEQYGTDALRAALVFQVTEGNDVALSPDKLKGMRNFGNKVWNIARFITMEHPGFTDTPHLNPDATLTSLQKELKELKKTYANRMEKKQFGLALEGLHEFVWHRFADVYLEELKPHLKAKEQKTRELLQHVLEECLIMLHPFMPFVTDAIWQELKGKGQTIVSFEG